MNVAIVEDEQIEMERLKGHLLRLEKEKNIQFSVTWYKDAVDFLTGYRKGFDIVFLDIQMPFMNGMTAAEKLRKIDPEVCLIFVTNLIDYAVKGYAVNASDFMVKPVGYYAFAFRMERVLAKLSRASSKSIVITSNRTYYRVNLRDICYIEAMGHQLTYHTTDGEIISYDTIKNISTKLDKNFVSPRSGVLVNLQHVTKIEEDDIIIGNERIAIARSKRKELLKAFTMFVAEIS